jgi:MFS family permease
VLFLIWSVVGFVAEVPTGALADRFNRRVALVGSSLLQALGYVLWFTLPGFFGFAAGFVLWGLGGALASGSIEALLYDGLAAAGAEDRYAQVNGRVTAMGLISQIPAAFAASTLFSLGGYALAGWVSVGCCLAASGVASLLPEPAARTGNERVAGYLETLRTGLAEVVTRPVVRYAVIAVAVIGGMDAIEEYFPLMAGRWGVPTAGIPLALVCIPIAGAAGAVLGATANRLRPSALSLIFGVASLVFGASGLLSHPSGLAGIAAFYFLYHLVLVALDARLQANIEGPSRATVTSVASLGIELAAIFFLAVWAVGELKLVAAIGLLIAFALPRWLPERELYKVLD